MPGCTSCPRVCWAGSSWYSGQRLHLRKNIQGSIHARASRRKVKSPPTLLPVHISCSKPPFLCNEVRWQNCLSSMFYHSCFWFLARTAPNSLEYKWAVSCVLPLPQVVARDLDQPIGVSHLSMPQGFVHQWTLDPREVNHSIRWNCIGKY